MAVASVADIGTTIVVVTLLRTSEPFRGGRLELIMTRNGGQVLVK